MRLGQRWVDACIRQASPCGLLVEADELPAAGSEIELRRGAAVLIGYVVWQKDGRFGLRSHRPIDLAALMRPPEPPPAKSVAPRAIAPDRRAAGRPTLAEIADRAERNRQRSAAWQFGTVVVASFGVAILIAAEIYQILAAPLDAIGAALG